MAEDGAMTPKSAAPRVTFRDVLRIRTFGVLYAAETQSVIGDQLARVALSILVFNRTGSASATALTYACTFLPAILGGALLSSLGDKYARVAVMIGADLVRAGLFAGMAIPGLPLPVVVLLLVLAVLIGPAFKSAEISVIATVLDPAPFRVANGLRLITNQIAQAAGLAVGGVIVAALHPTWALLVDAASFVASAVIIALCMPKTVHGLRPQSGRPRGQRRSAWWRVLVEDRHMRMLFGLTSLAGFFVVPEGLAVPYARSIGAGPVGAGLLLAAIPFGAVIGAWLVVRRAPGRRHNLFVAGLAAATGIPLLVTAARPDLPVSVALWALSGVCSAYQVDVITSIARSIPDAFRSRTTGLAAACLAGAQGLGVVIFGGVAEIVSASTAVAVAAVLGIGGALVIMLMGARHDPRTDVSAVTGLPSRRGDESIVPDPNGVRL